MPVAIGTVIPFEYYNRWMLLPCHFKAFFHLPCATCGMSRAFFAIGHGDFSTACLFNPLAPALFMGFLFLGCGLLWLPEKTSHLIQSVHHQIRKPPFGWGRVVFLGLIILALNWIIKLTLPHWTW
ncbi:MAG: DUF2752 domain-containing protein [Cyanobacteria bacterium]|nr:DUF2752 domain-containing protein [Cyanobacteriota bacterium]